MTNPSQVADFVIQTTPDGLANASSDVTSSFASANELGGVLIAILWVLVIMGLLAAARNSEWFGRILDAMGVFATSIYYAIHGLAAVTSLVVLAAPVYLLATADPSTKSTVGKYAVGAVVAYAAMTVIGYGFKNYIVNPILENADEHDLLPEPDDDVEEVAD